MTEEVDKALDRIHKKYGESAIMKMGERPEMNIESISTGNIKIDLALGNGGLPKGRIVELYGPESSGKSTFCLHVIASAQSVGGTVAFIDVEHALDPKYAAALGVNVEDLYISQPDWGEQALDIVDELAASGGFSVIVVDSVAALTPKAEIAGDMGDAHVGLQARMMSQALRKITANVNNTKTLVIFTNQIREKIGVLFGSPETTPGGRGLKFYSSVRIDLRRRDLHKDKGGGDVIGNDIRIKVVKNKVDIPLREAVVELEYGRGFNPYAALLDVGVEMGLLHKNGAWYATIDGEKMGQGREKAAAFIEDNPQYAKELEAAIWEKAQG